jgi:hypothetical protein
MAAALNTQIGNEFGAFLQYVSIGAHFGSENLPGLSAHFYKQAMEERTGGTWRPDSSWIGQASKINRGLHTEKLLSARIRVNLRLILPCFFMRFQRATISRSLGRIRCYSGGVCAFFLPNSNRRPMIILKMR